MGTALFFSFLGSLVICMALIPPLMASAGRLHILDIPGGRKAHAGSVAKVGGIALAAGTFIGVLVWAPKDDMVLAGLLGGLIILAFGVWDDRIGLGYQAKFAGQALAALCVLLYGGVGLSSLPFLPEAWFGPWLGLPLSFLILLAVTNAVNLADGLDGLAGGLSLISFAAIAYLAFQNDDLALMLMVVAILGGLLGFLRFNTYPAKIFMGDAGSQFLGFFLGVTGLVLIDGAHGPYSPMLALFVWGIPLLDMAGVFSQRLREGRSPFVGDRNHLHHKLLGRGWSHREAVTWIYAGQVAMVATAYALRWQPDWLLAAVYAGAAAVVLSFFVSHGPGSKKSDGSSGPQPETAELGWWERHARLAHLPLPVLGIAVSGFLLASVALPGRIPPDAGAAAALLLALLGVAFGFAPHAIPWLVRAGLYVGSSFVLYFGETGRPLSSAGWMEPSTLFLMVVAGLVMLVMRLNAVRQFETTPLDSLMLLLALFLPLLPELHVGEVNLSVLTAKLIVLFFSFELLLQAYADRLKLAGLLAGWVLAGITVRAWL